jgi:hypothetical protein
MRGIGSGGLEQSFEPFIGLDGYLWSTSEWLPDGADVWNRMAHIAQRNSAAIAFLQKVAFQIHLICWILAT